ncbi:MAG: type II 3-dehydroquinate dehydratase [Dehalococcoidia bacterium]|nr:type II 3-dehydroquinate dehydratase [Dehalococcoidia bacterium]MDH4299053.1 type II 3-dehydroquinate dehydratase [Dehalococcoidia bacterium]MDH4367668.1 type II 3-dehydroquinate dehydratase [Dehalococcoidia bacterium]
MRVLVIHGPNLNMLGKREKSIYGEKTLDEINALLRKEAQTLNVELATFQSNHEGALIDFIQEQADSAQGIIINPGALTHYGFSLLDALVDSKLPVIEVHLSDIYHREEWRAKSVIAPIAEQQIIGLGWKGYINALQVLASGLKAKTSH